MQPFGEDRVVEAQRWQLAVLRRPLCVESGQRRLCVSGRRGAEPPHAFLVLWDERKHRRMSDVTVNGGSLTYHVEGV